jgi:hypothetical protein
MYSLALIIFVVSEKKAFEHFPIGLFNIGPYGENVSKRFFSETTWTIETKLPRNDHWKVLYTVYGFFLYNSNFTIFSFLFIILYYFPFSFFFFYLWGRRGRDRMVVGFITTYAISVYNFLHQFV